MKCIDSVKPLRPASSTKISTEQNVSVFWDDRWSHRPLYEFVLEASLPATEKLLLLCVASYRNLDSNNFVHFGIMQPTANDLQQDTGLPHSVVTNLLKSLYGAGYIRIENLYGSHETYVIHPSLPIFHEYFCLSRIRNCVSEAQREAISAQLDSISKEIRAHLCLDYKPLERIEKLYPGLYITHVQKWSGMEVARSNLGKGV